MPLPVAQKCALDVGLYGDHHPVGHARHAAEFDEIDEPAALDFSSRSVGVSEREIIAFRNDQTFLLVRVLEVHNSDYGADRCELKLDWRLRVPRA